MRTNNLNSGLGESRQDTPSSRPQLAEAASPVLALPAALRSAVALVTLADARRECLSLCAEALGVALDWIANPATIETAATELLAEASHLVEMVAFYTQDHALIELGAHLDELAEEIERECRIADGLLCRTCNEEVVEINGRARCLCSGVN